MSKKPKVPVPISDLENQFRDQLDFLSRSMRDFDAGMESEYRRMAATLRVLLHKSKSSHPLADQVGLSETLLPSYAEPIDEQNLVSEHSLVGLVVGSAPTVYMPMLDRGWVIKRMLPLTEWKDELVLRDGLRKYFSRWDIVLAVANQDGGSHSDPAMDEAYYNLSRKNSVGWAHWTDDPNHSNQPITGIERAYVRHIAWEAHSGLSEAWQRLAGNRGCTCGSGRKARYCCMRRQMQNTA